MKYWNENHALTIKIIANHHGHFEINTIHQSIT
jgi:hypothetical protein